MEQPVSTPRGWEPPKMQAGQEEDLSEKHHHTASGGAAEIQDSY